MDVTVLLMAFLIGALDGLRSLTAPAVVAWSANRGWLGLDNSPLAFMQSTPVAVVFTLGALGELVYDKLPRARNRTEPPGLMARIVFGGVCGAAIASSGAQSIALGAGLGALGGIAGAFGGYQARTRLVRALTVPGFVIACLEDAVAIGGSVLVVASL